MEELSTIIGALLDVTKTIPRVFSVGSRCERVQFKDIIIERLESWFY